MAKKSSARRRLEAKKQQPEYSPERLTKDLDCVRRVHVKLGRGRCEIYDYWGAVYRLRRKGRRFGKGGVKVKKIANRAVSGGVPLARATTFFGSLSTLR